MEINFNLGFLKTVHVPIMESLNKAIVNLEENIAFLGSGDSLNLTASAEIHKSLGAFRAIGLMGVFKVASAVEDVINVVATNKLDAAQSENYLREALDGIRNIVYYVDQLLQDELDQPIKLFSNFKKLKFLLNPSEAVSVKELFYPKLDFSKSCPSEIISEFKIARHITAEEKNDYIKEIKGIRDITQKNIISMLHSLDKVDDPLVVKSFHESCRVIFENLHKMQEMKLSKGYYLLFGLQKLFVCVISPVFNLSAKDILLQDSRVIKLNLTKIEKELKDIFNSICECNGDVKTNTLKPDDVTVKELLFFLGISIDKNNKLKEMPIYKEVMSTFNLDMYVNQLHNQTLQVSEVQKSPELLENINKVFIELREDVVTLTTKTENSLDNIPQLAGKLYSIIYKFNELIAFAKVEPLIKMTNSLLSSSLKLKNKEGEFNDAVKQELSLAVVIIENGLNNFIRTFNNEGMDSYGELVNLQTKRLDYALSGKFEELNGLNTPELDSRSKREDEKKAFSQIFSEISSDLGYVEEILDQYFRSNGENEKDLLKLSKPLRSTRGALAMTGHKEMSEILLKIIDIFDGFNDDTGLVVSEKDIKVVSSVLGGIVLYVNAIKEENEEESYEILTNTKILLEGKDKVVVNKIPVAVSSEKDEINIKDVVVNTSRMAIVDKPSDAELCSIYLEEVEGILEEIRVNVLVLVSESNNREVLITLRRAFHTLKGSGRMVGLIYLGEAGWLMEQTLNKWLSEFRPATRSLIDVVEVVAGYFVNWIVDLKNHNQVEVNLHNVLCYIEKINPSVRLSIDLVESVVTDVQENVVPVMESVDSQETIDIQKNVEPVMEFIDIQENIESEVAEPIDIQENVEPVMEFIDIQKNVESEVAEPIDVQENVEPIMEFVDIQENVEAEIIEPIDTHKKVIEFEPAIEFVYDQITIDVQENIEPVIESAEITQDDNYVETVKSNDTVNIGGMEISSSLYQLFDKESEQYLNQMYDYIKELSISKEPTLSYEFMRYAHTLSSISRTVNLVLLGDLSSFLETTVKLGHERNIVLDQASISTLYEVVVALEELKNDLDCVMFEEVLLLKEKLINLGNFFSSYKETIEDVYTEEVMGKPVVDIPIAGKSEMNMDRLVEDIVLRMSASFNIALEERVGVFVKALEDQEKRYETQIADLMNKVVLLQNDLSEVNSKQTELKTSYANNSKALVQGLVVVRRELGGLSSDIKKKLSERANIIHDGEVINVNQNDQFLLTSELPADEFGAIVEYTSTKQGVENNQLEETIEEELSDIDVLNDEELFADTSWFDELLNNSDFMLETSEMSDYSDVQNKEIFENDFINEIFREKVSILEDDIDAELFPIAEAETREQLEMIYEIIEDIDSEVTVETSHNLKRLLHTIKGSSRMAGAYKIGGIAHRVESLMDYTEVHNIHLNVIRGLLKKEVNKIVYLLDHVNSSFDEARLRWLDNEDFGVSQGVSDTSAQESDLVYVDEKVEVKKQAEAKIEKQIQIIKVSGDVIDNLVNEAGEIRLTRTNLEGTISGNKKQLAELKSISSKLHQMLREIEIQAETQMQNRQSELASDGSDFDPLEFDRFTRLQELTRFMAEAVSDIHESVINVEGFTKQQDSVVNQQLVLTNSLLSQLMKVRLVTVDSIADRLYKITRNTARELGKKVMLELVGENTEIDRIILDRMTNPIEHILRNCIAHGIELPEDRVKKNKPPIGKIVMSTKVDGNFTVFELSDDGAGININKIKDLAIKKGIYDKNKSYTENEIIDFIFAPNFSTSDSLSQVSGRGVGMDIARTEITSLGGFVKVETTNGMGSKFIISLPLSVATSQAMLANVGEHLIAIPALLVEEVLLVKRPEMLSFYDNHIFEYHDVKIPAYYLGHLLGGPLPKEMRPEIKNYNTLIVASHMGEKVVIHVDQLFNTTEILIKNAGKLLSKISGILGTTILGDGRQGLIVNPVMLKKHWEKYVITEVMAMGGDMSIGKSEVESKSQITVMVVDDSLVVRRATSRILERHGYMVILGKDGEDALEQIQIHTPDIILSDVEMPRMDGFEFSKNIRNSDKYGHIPIIMITSRTADKHRQYALSLGVNAYLGKPYQEEELINAIRELTNTPEVIN